MSGIDLVEVARTFPGGIRAVLPTSLQIATGEVVALLGPSGCGKTTLLRIIAGLETLDPGGRISLDGKDVTHVPVERRGVGMVFQHFALFPNMSVAENVGYGLKMQGLNPTDRAARVAEVLSLCEVAELSHRPITALSGGQRQRVALARAIAPAPRVVLLDEPLSALDAGLRERLRDELARLLRRVGITAILVTHDQSEAMAIADRVAVMRAGRVVQIAPPRELYERPTDAWIARFVGNAMDLDGRVEGGHLHLPGGRLAVGAVPPDARVLIRPQDFMLVDRDAAPLRGTVSRAIYLGDRLRIELVGVTTGSLMVDLPNDVAVQTGQELGLAPRPGALMILSDPKDDAA